MRAGEAGVLLGHFVRFWGRAVPENLRDTRFTGYPGRER
jgi:hypothetical protein